MLNIYFSNDKVLIKSITYELHHIYKFYYSIRCIFNAASRHIYSIICYGLILCTFLISLRVKAAYGR